MSDEGQEVEAIRASDLMKLMEVVKAATGLYNVCEHHLELRDQVEFRELGDALRALGLNEVEADG
jgi:hypothetical protein